MLDYRKLTRNGQLTLPIWYRDKYHLETGEIIELVEVDQGLLLKPLKKNNKKEAIKQLIAFLDSAGDDMEGMSEEDVMDLVNKEIKAYRKESQHLRKNDYA